MKILLPNYGGTNIGVGEILQGLGHEVYSVYTDIKPNFGTHYRVPKRIELDISARDHKDYITEVYRGIIERNHIDLILPAPGTQNILKIIGLLNTEMGLPGLPTPVMDRLEGKHEYSCILREHGFTNLAHTYGVIDPDSHDRPNVEFPVIMKPSLGSGGEGVFVARTREEYDWFLGVGDKPSGPGGFYRDRFHDGQFRNYMFVSNGEKYLVEEFLEGDLISAYGFISDGKFIPERIHDIDVYDFPLRSECGFHQPSKFDVSPIGPIMVEVSNILQIDKGPVVADFIRNPSGGFALIDFSPRMSGAAFIMDKLSGDFRSIRKVLDSLLGIPIMGTPMGDSISVRSMMFRKGIVEHTYFPQIDHVHTKDMPEVGDSFMEPRNDAHSLKRGIVYSMGEGCRERTRKFVSETNISVKQPE